MSVHHDCGEEIKWARRADDTDRWNPPLEYAGTYYIIDEAGSAIQVTAYQIHNCDPDKMEAWLERCKKVAALKGGDLDSLEVRAVHADMQREEIWEEAVKRECPRCAQPIGEKCISLAQTLVKSGIKRHTKNPHPERLGG